MDEEALVETLVTEGALLESALQTEAQLPGASAIVARDDELDEWHLLLPVPREYSRLHFYETLQELLERLDLTLPLDRIVLVKDTDPGLRELRGVSAPYFSYRSWRTAPIEVGGRHFSDSLRVRIEPRVFEQQVATAIASALPDAEFLSDRDMRTLGLASGTREMPLPVDFALSYRGELILVEVKTSRRPITQTPTLAAFGALCYMQRVTRQTVRLAFISMTGFSDRVEHAFGDFPDIALVSWQFHQDPELLGEAVQRLARGPSPF